MADVIIIPPEALQPQTLDALIEEFVTRDGAIQGHTDTSLPAQMEAVKRQLKSGKAVIVFDTQTETCTIVAKDEFPHQRGAHPG